MSKLQGKKALITGGTTGIGFATAKLFIEHGAKVAITGQNEKRVHEAGQQLGPDALPIVADVSSLDKIDNMTAAVNQQYGKIDILFVNAGIFKVVPFSMVDEAHYDELMNINVKGAFFTIQKALPILNDGGSIIINSSIASKIGVAGVSVYGATKAAVRSLSRTIAAELLDRKIRVNTVSPGPVDTPIFGKTGLDEQQSAALSEQIMPKIPMGRFGTAEEVAKAVLFFAGDDSTFTTGSEIMVDGGWTEL